MENKLTRTEIGSIVVQARKRMTGRVRWYNSSLCYGFVRAEETPDGEDIFFHKNAIQVPGVRSIRDGQRVVFERCATSRGVMAMNVVPIAENLAEVLDGRLAGMLPTDGNADSPEAGHTACFAFPAE